MSTSFNPAVDLLAVEGRRRFPWINVALFLLTICTTLFVGTFLMADFSHSLAGQEMPELLRGLWRNPAIVLSGLPFSIAIMTILFAHEMGHYLTCRYYGIDATLPYFVPMPLSPVGTMGAFIRIKSPIHNRPALLDVGVAGPIAGFVLAVPTLVVGLMLSRFVTETPQSGFGMGEPLIFKLAAHLLGKTPPPGMELYIHPIGFAAWFGFFATAMNLLPAGQLDGGHISYALFRGLHQRISLAFVVTLVPLGAFFWRGWFVWTALLLFLGLRHPVTLDDSTPLERRHIWLGWIALAMFVLCFTPIPFYFT